MVQYGRALAGLAALVALAVGCTDDGKAASRTAAEDAAVAPTTTDASTTEASTTTMAMSHLDGGVLTLHAHDYSYGDLPDTVPAGTELALVNDSSKEVHEVVALKLPDDERRSVAELAGLSDADRAFLDAIVPTVVMVDLPAAADGTDTPTRMVFGTAKLDQPGRYLLICSIPTGIAPDEYVQLAAAAQGPVTVPGKAPHWAQGMVDDLTVTG